MMKADIGAPVERDRLIRRLNPPQGDNVLAVRDECRGIFRPLTNNAPAQAIAEEAAGALEISDAQTDVIDAACGGRGVLCHGIFLWCAGASESVKSAVSPLEAERYGMLSNVKRIAAKKVGDFIERGPEGNSFSQVLLVGGAPRPFVDFLFAV
jgi:hypothetical protein